MAAGPITTVSRPAAHLGIAAAACLYLVVLAGCWLNPWDPLGKADDVKRHHAEPMQNRQWMDVSGGPWQGLPESAGVP
jgi:hypothetical protein